MKRSKLKYVTKSLYLSLILMALSVNVAMAFGPLGTEQNARCAAEGRVPSAPFNGANCTLCHDNGPGGGSGGGKSAYKRKNNDFFCKVPPMMNTAPVADAGGPYMAKTGVTITFDGTVSMDADGDPLTYSWNFGDGMMGSGVKPSHAYSMAGTYNVTLTVNDGTDTATNMTTATITDTPPPTGNNIAPVLGMIGDRMATVDMLLEIPLSATDADGDSLTFTAMNLPMWLMLTDNGNGTGSLSGTPATIGSYDITVKVTDNGIPSLMDQETFTLTVKDGVTPPAMMDYELKAKAKWKRDRKELKVKGKIKMDDEDGDHDEDDDRVCSSLMDEVVTISNELGKTLATTSINCKGKFKVKQKVNKDDVSCYVTVSVAETSLDVMVKKSPAEDCMKEDDEDKDDGKDDEDKDKDDDKDNEDKDDD